MDCRLCPTDFDCQTLHTLLCIMEKHRDELADAGALARYEELTSRLADAGWAYPLGLSTCALAGRSAEVRALTRALVDLWREHAYKSAAAPAELSLYADEVKAE